ncbi:MAG: proline--tRNA ligase, partial [Candidatus Cloacimonetes bacterium]|nr:proline--tRNA ligase [Candidatus Cloacimonadota bacterium]
EFLWQEGHTAHETEQECAEETALMLEVYRDFAQDYLAIPVVTGRKTEQEKFPGAVATWCIEGYMQDGKALQMGTSHNLGQNFAKAFEIQFSGRDNTLQHAWTTSWGVSTRLIGALIMVHSDDDGLVLPPRMAPVKAAVVPLWKNDEEREAVEPFAHKALMILQAKLGKLAAVQDLRDDARPADRFFHWAQKGVPCRLEIGPRDAAKGTVCLVTRHDRKKRFLSLDELEQQITVILEEMQQQLFDQALQRREDNTVQVDNWADFESAVAAGKWIRAHWDGTTETELKIKEATKATIRCIPDDMQAEDGKCVFSGKPSKGRVLFALSY